MSYMKEFFSKDLEKTINQFIRNYTSWEDEVISKEDLTKETFEVTKGDYKSIATLYFDKNGFLVTTETSSKLIPARIEEQIKNLENLRDKAASQKDFLAAHRFQLDIDEKKKML